MKHILKRTLAFALSVSLCAALLASCSGPTGGQKSMGGNSTDPKPNSSGAASDFEEVEIDNDLPF